LRDLPSAPPPEDDDPWGFAAARGRRSLHSEGDQPTVPSPAGANAESAGGAPTPGVGHGGESGRRGAGAAGDPEAHPGDGQGGVLHASHLHGGHLHGADGEHGAMADLRRRARPLALALAAVFAIGFISEIVAAARFVHLLGARALIIIYPLGGVALLAVALVEMTWIDRIRRDRAFVLVCLAYAATFTVALCLVAVPSTTVVGTGLVWLLADQLNFLLPLIVWAIIGDVFNAGEGRRIYPWITSWRYGGQMVGLVVPTVAPLLMVALGTPLPWILIACPVGLVALAVLVPRSLRGRSIGQGSARTESTLESIRTAWGVVSGVKAFTAMFVTSLLAFVAGMALEGSFLTQADAALHSEAQLEVLYGLTLTVVFAICWILQRFAITALMEKLDIPGSLAVLPVAVVVAAVVVAAGVGLGTLGLVILGVVLWRVPWWSIDDVARRSALALIPDERRTRVSFVVDLVPFAVGLVVAGGTIAATAALHVPILASLVALPVGAASIPTSRVMVARWQDALLSPQLKRRKRLAE